MRRKKELPELLIDVKLTRRKLQHSISRLDQRIKTLEAVAIQSSSTITALSARIAKEIDQLERIKKRLYTLDVLLEMLEIRLETVISVGGFLEALRPVATALKEVGKSFPIPMELSTDLDDLLSSLGSYVSSGSGINIFARKTVSEETRRILEEAESIANIKIKGEEREKLQS